MKQHCGNAKSQRSTAIAFAGGGTGGHLFPGIAIVAELQELDSAARVLFMGSEKGVERRILEEAGLEHIALPAKPLNHLRKHPFDFAKKNWQAYRKARSILVEQNVQAVVGLGGYASLPAIWAARSLKLPTVLLEQNMIPGRANYWLSRFADLTCLSFSESQSYFPKSANTCITGNPVRREISNLCSSEWPDFVGTKPVLLILGGSQGASAVNRAVVECFTESNLSNNGFQIVHQTGFDDVAWVQSSYQKLGIEAVVEPFISDLTPWYQSAGLVVSRAGATTLAELACAGCPAVLVPYPYAAKNHQWLNAEIYQRSGAAKIVKQEQSVQQTTENLGRVLQELMVNDQRRQEMTAAMKTLAVPQAAKAVAVKIMDLMASPISIDHRDQAGQPVSEESNLHEAC